MRQALQMTPETARQILDLDFPKIIDHRMTKLKCGTDDGTLSGDEKAELESLIRSCELLAELQSKAREALKKFGQDDK
jgi:hypothetical protein